MKRHAWAFCAVLLIGVSMAQATLVASGPTNNNNPPDLIAIALYTGSPFSQQLNTTDDKGIRVSDPNWTLVKYQVN